MGSGFTAGQSILTPRGQNLTSSTAVEWDTRLSPRTSLTFVGGYALLHYYESGPTNSGDFTIPVFLSNYGDATFQAGYNYQLTRKDTIAVSYLFSCVSL